MWRVGGVVPRLAKGAHRCRTVDWLSGGGGKARRQSGAPTAEGRYVLVASAVGGALYTPVIWPGITKGMGEVAVQVLQRHRRHRLRVGGGGGDGCRGTHVVVVTEVLLLLRRQRSQRNELARVGGGPQVARRITAPGIVDGRGGHGDGMRRERQRASRA